MRSYFLSITTNKRLKYNMSDIYKYFSFLAISFRSRKNKLFFREKV